MSVCRNIARLSMLKTACYKRTLATNTGSRESVAKCVGENQKQRENLAAAFQGLHHVGLSEGIGNHLSTRAPARDGQTCNMILLSPYGLHWSEVTASSLVGIDIENGNIVEGSGTPEATCLHIHCEVYKEAIKNNENINSVFHVHPPYATALGCHKDPTLKMISQNAAEFFNNIAYDKGYGGFGNTASEGARIAETMGTKSVMLMGNHGTLVTGERVANAFLTTYYLERAAMIQILAQSTGEELVELDNEVADKVRQVSIKDYNFHSDLFFDAIKRLIKKEYINFTN